MRGGQLWTSDRIDLLIRLWRDGKTAVEIASRLGGLSRSAVLGKIFRLRLGPAEAEAGSAAAPKPNGKRGRPPRPPGARRSALAPPDAPSDALTRRRGAAARQHARPPAAANARGLSLMELTNHSCRWPIGIPGRNDFYFCGTGEADLERGMPYCPLHARRAYNANAGDAANPAAKADGENRKLRPSSAPPLVPAQKARQFVLPTTRWGRWA